MTLELNFLEIREYHGKLWAVVQLVNDQDNDVFIPETEGFTFLDMEFNSEFAGTNNARYFEDTENFKVIHTKRTLVFH